MRKLWYWIVWKVFRIPSVILVDFDGEENIRFVWGCNKVQRMQFVIESCGYLRPNGKVSGPVYVTKWKPLFGEVE